MVMRHEEALALTQKIKLAASGFGGKWVNELNSVMNLTVTGTDLSGTYTSQVSGDGGAVTGELSGYINGNLISFIVNWPTAALTAWVGQMVSENGEDVLETLWQMTTKIPDPGNPSELWESVLAGADRFHR
jgi:hypothetical protein